MSTGRGEISLGGRRIYLTKQAGGGPANTFGAATTIRTMDVRVKRISRRQ